MSDISALGGRQSGDTAEVLYPATFCEELPDAGVVKVQIVEGSIYFLPCAKNRKHFFRAIVLVLRTYPRKRSILAKAE